jgi:signal transduction histidine kinase
MNALVEHARGQGDPPRRHERRPHSTLPQELDRRVSSPEDDRADKRRRQLGHDIRHELSTVMMLASSLSMSHDAGPDSRRRAHQILGEMRWLDQLLRVYDGSAAEGRYPGSIRIDAITRDVVNTMSLCTDVDISVVTCESWSDVDGLTYWRALRNVVDNAVRAVGSVGVVVVSVSQEQSQVVVQIEDDGPGLLETLPDSGSLGLTIVREIVASWGGDFEIGPGSLGGCRVRLLLPATTSARDYRADAVGA